MCFISCLSDVFVVLPHPLHPHDVCMYVCMYVCVCDIRYMIVCVNPEVYHFHTLVTTTSKLSTPNGCMHTIETDIDEVGLSSV